MIYKSLVGLLVLGGLSGMYAGQKVKEETNGRALIRAYSQEITYTMPSDWNVAFQNHNNNQFILKIIPKNEKLKNWKNMFSIHGHKGVAKDKTKTSTYFLNQLKDSLSKQCKGNFVYEFLGKTKISGNDASKAIIGCAKIPKSKNMGEIGQVYVVISKDDMYIMNKSMATKAFDPKKPPLNKNNISNFTKNIEPIKFK